MGGLTSPAAAPRPVQDARLVAALLLASAAAWAGTVLLAGRMSGMSGTMGLGLAAFVAVWLLMMAAMMLPAVIPATRLYARTLPRDHTRRALAFVSGYLIVWLLSGIPAYALAMGADWVARHHPEGARWAAVATFVLVAVYELTPLKAACLRTCRSPFGLLLRYAGYRGRLRDLRAGADLGRYCLGCCWALFLVLLALGVMNLAAMIVLGVVVTAEKLWTRGPVLSRAVAAAAIVAAVAVAVHPALAAGLYSSPTAPPMPM